MMHRPIMGETAGAMNMIAALLEQRTGQQIAANRAWRVETALKPLLREYEMDSLDDLVARLVTTPGHALGDQVVDALLNQESSFFRDSAVLDMVADAAASITAGGSRHRLRIWSAGCSNGQEPLSLAMLFAERSLGNPLAEPEIVATDVSKAALTRARAARYSQFEIQRGLPVRRMMTWFDSDAGEWVARQDLVRRIQFRQHNLAADPAPPGKFDIVLCRNVLLYFSLPLRQKVFETLSSAVRPGGFLVLGAGETVIGQTDAFSPSEKFRGFYRLASDVPVKSKVA